jgi:hypothetical protein
LAKADLSFEELVWIAGMAVLALATVVFHDGR